MLSDDDGLDYRPVRSLGGGVLQVGETFVYLGLTWTARNPAEALAAAAILSNPSLRGVFLKILKHQAIQWTRDLRFYGRVIASDLVTPIFTYARAQARGALRHPASWGAAAVLSGAVITAANQQLINNNAAAVNPRLEPGGEDSLARMWSPFGGFQLGTAIS